MKKKWKILTYILGSVAIVGTIVALPVALTSKFQSSSPINNFFTSFNDPYKELTMFAQSLDSAYNGRYNFEQKANIVNNSMKTFINKLSNVLESKNKKQTILFIKNDSLVFTNDENSKMKVNQFWCEQPMLFPAIYASSSNKQTPGLNYYFPAPINSNANSLFDDWFEIGASSFQSAYNKYNISQRIVTGWANTCDYVFYLYDSNVIQNEEAFISYVLNTSDSSLWANKLLKNKNSHVIPLDMQWFYYGIWDQVGTFIMLYLLTNIITNAVNPMDINLNRWDRIKWNSQIERIASSMNWTPKKSTTLKTIRPFTNEPNHQNYLATLYNLVGHSFSLGIFPDYIMKFNEDSNNKKYNDLAGYLDWFKCNNLFKFNFINQNTLSTVSSIRDLKLYALSANRDILGENAIWPVQSDNGISFLHDTTPSEVGNIIGELGIKCAFSERNDTSFTQTFFNDDIIFDIKANKTYTVEQWVSKYA